MALERAPQSEAKEKDDRAEKDEAKVGGKRSRLPRSRGGGSGDGGCALALALVLVAAPAAAAVDVVGDPLQRVREAEEE